MFQFNAKKSVSPSSHGHKATEKISTT